MQVNRVGVFHAWWVSVQIQATGYSFARLGHLDVAAQMRDARCLAERTNDRGLNGDPATHLFAILACRSIQPSTSSRAGPPSCASPSLRCAISTTGRIGSGSREGNKQ